MPSLCETCPLKPRGCQHQPEDFIGRELSATMLTLMCVHTLCPGAVREAENNITYRNPTSRIIEDKIVDVWPVGTFDKPTVPNIELLPSFCASGERREDIQNSRNFLINKARSRKNGSVIIAELRERVVDKKGTIYSADHNGDMLRTGQNINNPIIFLET